MAFRRKSKKFRKPRKPSSLLSRLKRLENQQKKLKKETKPEKKYVDLRQTVSAPEPTGSMINLTPVAQGISASQRIGDKIRVVGTHGRIHIEKDPSNIETSVRVILFKDKQSNALTPAAAGLLESVGGVVDYQSPLNMDNAERFWVYKDKTYTLNNAKTLSIDLKMRKRLGFTQMYSTPTATIPNTDGLWVLFLSNQPTLTPTIDMVWRTRYTDV